MLLRPQPPFLLAAAAAAAARRWAAYFCCVVSLVAGKVGMRALSLGSGCSRNQG